MATFTLYVPPTAVAASIGADWHPLCVAIAQAAPIIWPQPEAPSVVVRGTHRVVVRSDLAWSEDAEREDRWALAGVPAPLVSEATLLDAFTVQLDLDRALRAGNSYTLTTTATVSDGSTPLPASFLGKRIDAGRPNDARTALWDIDIPVARNGVRGGDFTIGSSGDYSFAGGNAQMRQLVTDRLITVRGVLPWAPAYGSPLELKVPRPADVADSERLIRATILEIPYVLDAAVDIRFDGPEAQVIARVVHQAGQFTEAVTL